MLGQDELQRVIGRDVYDADDDKIGSAQQVYLDDQTSEPEWVTVRTGLFGTKESFVPLAEARVTDRGLAVPYTKAFVKDAPSVDDDGHLSPEEVEELYRYYNRDGRQDRDLAGGHDGDDRVDVGGTEGQDVSGPTTDDAMTVSEERLDVGTERREAGRARLRKYVVTENVTQTVPVQREEVRIEREPVTDANAEAARSGPAISEEEHEVVLHEERPVVEKEAVPVERVRLGTETVTEQETVADEVRKERVDVEGDTPTSTDRT